MIVQNPIRKGFYPDPSICRAGDYYYCVHSSFAYAPGIPIFRSKNLVDWEAVGHVLTRKSQLHLNGLAVREGIYAPTIRYHEGVFYVIVTNVGGEGNFYVTSTDPKKGWSDPYILPDAEGIDPSLFFENRKCYYVGQRLKKKPAFDGECEIWIRELDLKQHKLCGRSYVIWEGAMKKSIWDEGPHIYKKGEYYYLLVAEGGTAFSHSICVARSKYLMRPYEGCPDNPVFTHRHLGHEYPVQNVGHGDLIETPDSDWYIVMLGNRVLKGCSEMGRETFIADVTWQDDWPVINAGEGRLRLNQEIKSAEGVNNAAMKRIGTARTKKRNITLQEAIQKELLLGLRKVPDLYYAKFFDMGKKTAKESAGKQIKSAKLIKTDKIQIPFYPATLSDKEIPGFVGIRMEEHEFVLKAVLTASFERKQEAGLACFYDEDNMIQFAVRYQKNQLEVSVVQIKKGLEIIQLRQKIADYSGTKKKSFALKIQGHDQKLNCTLDRQEVIKDLDISFLCDQQTGGFTGTILGMFATSNHGVPDMEETVGKAQFSDLKIQFCSL